jgi:hypothetical protein
MPTQNPWVWVGMGTQSRALVFGSLCHLMGSVTNPIMRLILGYTIGSFGIEYHRCSVTYLIMKPILGYTNGQRS